MRTLAVTMGDPAGVGPEIIVACWRALRGQPLRLLVCADPRVMEQYGAPVRVVDASSPPSLNGALLDVWPTPTAPPVRPGMPDPASAPSTVGAIDAAVDLVRRGLADAIVTMPIAKAVLQAAGFGFPGHTEYLAHLTRADPMDGPRGPVMMLACEGLRVALATIHTPLASVPSALTHDTLCNTARVLARALQQDFGLTNPHIVLCGLNPHAGENGHLGTEEMTVINPAAATLRAEGIHCSDARAADSLFHPEARQSYDAVIAMYHDQGLLPIKTIAFHDAVNVTLGLPLVRTSPDHGVAFDIAGQGIARPDSALAAIGLAARMAELRRVGD